MADKESKKVRPKDQFDPIRVLLGEELVLADERFENCQQSGDVRGSAFQADMRKVLNRIKGMLPK